MEPIDVATNDTLEFVLPHLPFEGARILEVGSGDGHLAARLAERGFPVTAVDSSERAVERARALGVDARLARWPDFDDGPFDAVLFTRSLHHIAPLGAAVDAARRSLDAGGVLVVEDFGRDEPEPAGVAWLYHSLELLRLCGRLDAAPDTFAGKLLASHGDFESWARHHDPDLHRVGQMRDAAVAAGFDVVAEARVPYYYRYALPGLDAGAPGYALAARLLAAETNLGAVGAMRLVGWRLVARSR